MKKIWPTIVGYRSDENPFEFSFREFRPAHTARRYEDGQLNFPGFVGMKESITLLQEVSVGTIQTGILFLIDHLIDGLKRNMNMQVKSCMDESCRSGIVNLACRDPESIAKRLLQRGIVVSVRGVGLRISPHFYNTEGEIDKLVSELNAL